MNIDERIVAWSALIMALTALVPWIVKLFRFVFGPGKVEVHETGWIEVGYSVFGATIGLQGTLRGLDRDLFIQSMHTELIREKNAARYSFDWGAFRPPRITISRPQEFTFELPSGFMLITSQPHRYNIQFHDTRLQEELRPVLDELRHEWNEALAMAIEESGESFARFDEESHIKGMQEIRRLLYLDFLQNQKLVDYFGRLERLCYLEAGKYRLTLTIKTARSKRPFKKTWAFTLSEIEAQNLRRNSFKMLGDTCDQNIGEYSFAFVRYLDEEDG